MIRSGRIRSLLGYMAVAAIATAVAGGGIAIAATSGSTVKACANKKSGALRLASKCQKSEKKVTWNTRGPQGDQGEQGTAGATGAAGPSDSYVASSSGQSAISTTTFKTLSVTVPAGSYIVTASGDLLNGDGSHPAGMQVILYRDAKLTANYLDDIWVTAPTDAGGSIGPGAASATVQGSLTVTASTAISVEFSGYSSTSETVQDPILIVTQVGALH